MKIHAGRRGLASGLAVLIMQLAAWLLEYLLISWQEGAFLTFSLSMARLYVLLLSFAISFTYAFFLVWIAGSLYNSFAE